MRPSWLVAHLAHETQQHFASADGDRLAIMERPTLDGYRRYLAQIYGFEAPVEAACAATIGPELVRSHFKAHRLASDLEALGVAPGDVPAIPAPSFEAPEQALAWLWVVHRNTLVHGLVHRHVATLAPDTGCSYLSAFEGRAGALMGELSHAMEAAAHRVASCERMIAAAKHAFKLQHQWYSCDLIWRRRGRAA